MANICASKFTFRGEPAEISDFYNKIDEWFSRKWKNPETLLTGDISLKNLLIWADLEDITSSVLCRGEVIDISDQRENSFDVYIDSSWTPMAQMWVELLKGLGYKSIKFGYVAEEFGCELFQIYDPYGVIDDTPDIYVDGFYLGSDPTLIKLIDIAYWRKDDFIDEVSELIEINETDSLEEVIKKFDDKYNDGSDDEEYICIYQYEEVFEIYN